MKSKLLLVLLVSVLNLTGQNLQPTETDALLNVLVMDEEKKPQEGQEVIFASREDTSAYAGITDASGRFSILIPKGRKYDVQYKTFTANLSHKTLTIPADEGKLTFDYTIHIMPPKVYTLDNVFFDSGKTTLNKESFKELDELAEYMSKKTSMVIEIAGHTDNVGIRESNQQLSEDRALAVREYLIKKGIARERVIAKGYGDTQPVSNNDSPEGRQKNRRTEVRIITE